MVVVCPGRAATQIAIGLIGKSFAKELLQVRSGPPLLIMFGLVVLLGGAWATSQELRQFQSTPAATRANAVLGELTDGSAQPGLSMDSLRTYGDICLRVLPRLDARMASDDAARGLDHACINVIEDYAEATPVNGFAWYVLAFAGYYRNDVAALNRGLQMSQASSGNEFWLAQNRAALAERAIALLDPIALEGHLDDIALLATTTRGSRWLASRYLADSDARERITGVIEQLTVPQQGLFVTYVESAKRRRRGN